MSKSQVPDPYYNTFSRNSCTRAVFGCSKNSSGVPSSIILPLSINTIRVAISFAKLISCVTIIIVIPLSASSRINDSTSPIASGSSAEVGSSNNNTSGDSIIARTIATLCFCPPDREAGYAPALPGSPICLRSSIARFSAASRFISFNFTGASVRFSITVKLLIKLKCWNTIPRFRRTFRIFFSVTSSPLKYISPEVGSSIQLMQRRNVDFPDPDGPNIATRSPFDSSKLIPLNTLFLPYDLRRFFIINSTFLSIYSSVLKSLRRSPFSILFTINVIK